MIYLLEDDNSIRDLVIYTLNSQGMETRGFARPSLFWQAVEEAVPDLALLDIMLPEEDGISVLKKLRAAGRTARLPIIMLTAKGTEYDKVTGLDAGADDYITKPFGMMELLSRIRALLRRTSDLSARMRAAATAFTGWPVPSSWLPMAVTMVAISSGSQLRLSKIRKAMTAPDWEWSTRLTRLPISWRYPAIFTSSTVRAG